MYQRMEMPLLILLFLQVNYRNGTLRKINGNCILVSIRLLREVIPLMKNWLQLLRLVNKTVKLKATFI
jgi:hypothetical protein